jgi:hypothetical protein
MALVALAALLSNPAAALPWLTYYFRDFTVTFYPQRLFAARELAAGRWPWWNPYIEEGSFAMPAFYPPDLALAFWSGPSAASWMLTLHLPLAALAAFLLARSLRAGVWGAFVSGSVFALGGLAASSLSFWVFLEALAWAPLLVLTLRRAGLEGGRWTAAAAIVVGLSTTTLAVEFVGQALLLGVALALAIDARPRVWGRLALATTLGLGLAAVPIAVLAGILGETVRGAGFAPDVALGNAIHPVVLLQVLVPGLFGSLAAPVEKWWGGAFFSKGFPYFLSLYLGPISIALAVAGVPRLCRRSRFALLGLMALALWYSLGALGGLAPWVASFPVFRSFRFPSKAFLLPHLGVALLAGLGAERLGRREGWGAFAGAAGALGTLLLGLLGALVLGEGAGIVPWSFGGVRADVVRDVATSAALALGACGLGLLTRWEHVSPRPAVLVVTAALVLDLARAGAGLNPQVDPAFFRPLPEMAALRLSDLGGARVFSYGLDYSPAFLKFLRSAGPGKGLWSFFLTRQILAPYANMIDGVEAAEAKDLTSFVPRPRQLRAEDYDPAAVGSILERLRSSSVTRVLSLDALDHPDLALRAVVPAGPPDLAIHVYELSGSQPRMAVYCRTTPAGTPAGSDLDLEGPPSSGCEGGTTRVTSSTPNARRYAVDARAPGLLVVRDSHARGWRATVDGRAVPVNRAGERHMVVALPEGRHDVAMVYEPPGLPIGVGVFAASLVLVVALLVRGQGAGSR